MSNGFVELDLVIPERDKKSIGDKFNVLTRLEFMPIKPTDSLFISLAN
jgi:hypothetical protein